MAGSPQASRWRRILAVLGAIASYGAGLGTVVLVLVIFGVRPGNFAAWLVSPVGVVLVLVIGGIVGWSIRRGRRRLPYR
jgi:high-affinity Fe2+/Pb2+ permease